jgi:hypothetical protein
MDPLLFLEERDPFRRGIDQGIATAYHKMEHDRDLERAKMIAGEIAKVLKEMFKA